MEEERPHALEMAKEGAQTTQTQTQTPSGRALSPFLGHWLVSRHSSWFGVSLGIKVHHSSFPLASLASRQALFCFS
jgi:hypothetical protein